MATVTHDGWSVSVTTGSRINGAILNVCKQTPRAAGPRRDATGRVIPLSMIHFRYGQDNGKVFPSSDAAFAYALERGYLTQFVAPWCRHCRVRHRSEFGDRPGRTSWCPTRQEFVGCDPQGRPAGSCRPLRPFARGRAARHLFDRADRMLGGFLIMSATIAVDSPIRYHQTYTARGRNGPMVAQLGGFQATGAGRREALSALYAVIAGHQPRQAYIFANDGTVFHVYQMLENSWAYNIADADRPYPCGVMGAKSFEEACQQARKHAADCFGGVKGAC